MRVLFNGSLVYTTDIQLLSEGLTVYEVVRVIGGKILFFDDHLNRFFSSAQTAGLPLPYTRDDLFKMIARILIEENVLFGNLKFQAVLNGQTLKVDFMAWFIPHVYPSDNEYLNGVDVITFPAERPNPNAKVIHAALREQMATLLQLRQVFEIIMVHPDGYITEGSRSNFFMIKENEVFTAPLVDILPGITRKYVLQVCVENNIPLHEVRIRHDELVKMDSAFVSGTSPKILPVCKIDDQRLEVINPILKLIMKKFDELIENDLQRAPKFF